LIPKPVFSRNQLGIENEDELKEAEAALVGWRSFQYM